MHTDVKKQSDFEVTLSITAGEESLAQYKKDTLKRLQPEVSAPGFRKGKVPINLVEKQVDEKYLQSQFLDEALSGLYQQALIDNNIRPVDRPRVELGKFVPYTEIEFTVTVEVVPPIELADYKKIKQERPSVKVEAKEIEEVVENLQRRFAKKKIVKRAAKVEDEVSIDFSGKDADGKAVSGATGKDYPLVLGSKSFIPGFEEELEGLKEGDEKEFTLTFPKDYPHTPLANKDVTFSVSVKAVREVTLPKVDDKLAEESGPFKTVKELKEDIKKQLTHQKEQENESQLKDKVIEQIVEKSKLTPPPSLVEENTQSILEEFKQNLVYRGITYNEYLDQAGLSEEDFVENEIKPQAVRRVTTGLILAEIAEKENVQITAEELEVRMEIMKGQFGGDDRMAAQFNTPEAQREIGSRLLTEKTIDLIVSFATSK